LASDRVVIVGAGQGGVEAAISLRQKHFDGEIVVVGDEPDLPYQRPPLSKDFIKGGGQLRGVQLRDGSFFAERKIELLLGRSVTAIDRASKSVCFENGEVMGYGHLVLATGSRNRKLRAPGLDNPAVLELRTLQHAIRLMERLPSLGKVVVIGGGFIGLEVASLLRAQNVEVDVIEAAGRLMGRVVSHATSDYFRAFHLQHGVRLHFGVTVESVEYDSEGCTVLLSDGRPLRADAVLLAAGVVPNVELAAEAGLHVENGIVVDERLLTEDAAISALGDCASYPSVQAGCMVRLESVQNAVDHARTIAERLTGDAKRYDSLPWFWSYQGDARLQIAGLAAPGDQEILRGDPESRKFSVFLFRDGRAVATESINDPGIHMLTRRLLSAGVEITPEMACAPDSELKALLKSS